MKKLLLIFLFLSITATLHAGWLEGWSYRKEIPITGSTGAGSDYQVKVLVGESSGATGENLDLGEHCVDFPNDITFTDNDETTELSYYIESTSGTTPNRLTTFWVKVNDSLESGQVPIYIYYGKSGASSGSSVSATFTNGSFTDTFTDSSKINSGDSSNITVSGGNVDITQSTSAVTLLSTNCARAHVGLSSISLSALFDVGYDTTFSVGRMHSGARYTVNILKNSTINNAYLQIKSRAALSTTGITSAFSVENTGNATDFSTYADFMAKLANRTSEVAYNPPTWSNDAVYNSPSITSPVQTVINRSDWQSSNNMVAFWRDTGTYTSVRWRGGYGYTWNSQIGWPNLYIQYTAYAPSAILRAITIPTDSATRLAVGSQLSWNNNKPSDTAITYQIEYYNGSSWALIPDADLPGNSAGFTASAVDTSSVKTNYSQIRLRGNSSTTNGSATPQVNDWTVTYYYRKYVSSEPSVGSAESEETPPWLSGWEHRIKITIDNSVVDSNLTHFPVTLILGAAVGKTDADVSCVFDELTSDANRKKIAVTKYDGTSELYVEIEKWDDASEAAVLHISKSDWTVSGSSDTVIYLYYDVDQSDNTTYVADSGLRTEVWDSNYKMVQHMADNAGGNIDDSTSNNNDGTKTSAGNPAEADAKIGKGQDFSNDYIGCGDISSSIFDDTEDEMTFEAWVNANTLSGNDIIASKYSLTPSYHVTFDVFSSDAKIEGGAFLDGAGGNVKFITNSTVLSAATWYHVAVVFDLSAGNMDIYINGVESASTKSTLGSPPTVFNNNAIPFEIGTRTAASGRGEYWDGKIDGARLSKDMRSAAWIKASYYSGDDNLVTWGSCEQNIVEEFIPKITIF